MRTIQHLLTNNLDIWTAADTEKKSGRGRSSSNAISVYGITKLRQLILDLAVRGKLVPQDSNDESASEIFRRIQANKCESNAKRKIRKNPDKESIAEQEIQYSLPVGWVWKRLGQIGDWGAGATPLRSVSSYYGGAIPWFKSGELTADFIGISEETITDLALKECSLRLNQPGDVLIAMYGATIGKTAILKVAGTTNQAVCACTPYDGIYNRYLLVLLKAMKSNFIGQGAGGAQPNISREKIIVTGVAIPPVAEQYRIVTKVDELMTLCDQLEIKHINAIEAHEKLVSHLLSTLTQSQRSEDFNGNWQRIVEHFDILFTTESSIDALKQTLFQLAIMGKLVPQDFNDESASELVKLIHAAKAKNVVEGKIRKDIPSISTEVKKKLPELPLGWQWVYLGEIIELISGQHLKPDEYFESPKINSIPYITGPADFSEKGPIPIRYTFEKRSLSINGDILVTVKGSGVGKTNTVYQKELAISRQLMAVRPIIVNVDFIEKLLITLSKTFQELSVGIAIPGISRDDILYSVVGLPPLNEQSLIVEKVNDLLALCDQLKASISKVSKLQKTMADGVVLEHKEI